MTRKKKDPCKGRSLAVRAEAEAAPPEAAPPQAVPVVPVVLDPAERPAGGSMEAEEHRTRWSFALKVLRLLGLNVEYDSARSLRRAR